MPVHHRRNSSLAIIERGRQRAESLSAQSSSLNSVSEDSPSSSPNLGGSTSTSGGSGATMAAAGLLRRRIRPFAIMLVLGTVAFIFIIRPFILGRSSASSFIDNMSYSPSSSRIYPGGIPPLEGDSVPVLGANSRLKNKKPASPPPTQQKQQQAQPASGLKLTLAEELGAVVAYLTSLGANARIPHSIDPTRPIDAELILGFNTKSSRASAEVSELVRETWEINPVVMFGEVRQPTTKRLRRLLDNLSLSPNPVIIALDERDDSTVLTPLIQRLTGSTLGPEGLPILLVGGVSLGPLDDILDMNSKGELQTRLIAAGAKLHTGKHQ